MYKVDKIWLFVHTLHGRTDFTPKYSARYSLMLALFLKVDSEAGRGLSGRLCWLRLCAVYRSAFLANIIRMPSCVMTFWSAWASILNWAHETDLLHPLVIMIKIWKFKKVTIRSESLAEIGYNLKILNRLQLPFWIFNIMWWILPQRWGLSRKNVNWMNTFQTIAMYIYYTLSIPILVQ